MSWAEWVNPKNWNKESRLWLAQLVTDDHIPVSSAWMPIGDLTVCAQCKASYLLYRNRMDFYPLADIERIKTKALARIQAHHPYHPEKIEGIFFMPRQTSQS